MAKPTFTPGEIHDLLNKINSIGATDDDGISRLAYTDAESEAHEVIRNWVPENWTVETDGIGNLYATPRPNAHRFFLVGSHLDSVPNGGKYDGAVGVAIAAVVIKSIDKSDYRPDPAPMLVVWRAEESARFNQSTLGSQAAMGQLDGEILDRTAEDGPTLREAIASQGFDPTSIEAPLQEMNGKLDFSLDMIDGYLEAHNEQGPVLTDAECDIGVVTAIRAPTRSKITFIDRSNHAGTTPEDLKKDAMQGAAKAVLKRSDLVSGVSSDRDLVGNNGIMEPKTEQALNKIIGKVEVGVEFRSLDEEFRDEIEQQFFEACKQIAYEEDLDLNIQELESRSPVELDDNLSTDLEATAAKLGSIRYKIMKSGAGHDAMCLQQADIPSGLVFLPSPKGISHDPEEDVKKGSMTTAAKVMQRAYLSHANHNKILRATNTSRD